VRIGVDTGGTFTDFVCLSDAGLVVHKLRSTPDDPSRAIIAGATTLARSESHDVVHGSTVATNAILERKGAVVGLITTSGFEDVIRIGRQTRPELYNFFVPPPAPIVEASLTRGLDERLDANGDVLTPLRLDDLGPIAQTLKDAGAEIIAVCFLHAYANAAHERAAADRLRAAGWAVCTSSEVLPEYREYERWSTTVVNAYVTPIIDRYLGALETKLGKTPLAIMQSNGGTISAGAARAHAVRTVLSGPAAGVVGARFVAGAAGFDRVISFDMGGTSTDVSLLDRGVATTTESKVGDFPVRLPVIDIHTVGAGGGSIAHVDAGGALRVGPRSAGASPGPVCYGTGTELTVTDANLLLGRLDPEYFLGGRMMIDRARTERVAADVAKSLKLGVPELAEGIVRVANANMERAIRVVSVERGHDPRDFALVAFGGAGPVHGAALMQEVGIGAMLVPPYPGVLCAMGCASANVRYDYSRTVERLITDIEPGAIVQIMREQRAEGEAQVRASEAGIDTLTATHFIDMAYLGQIHAMRVPVEPGWSVDQMAAAFAEAYRAEFGNTLTGIPVMIINVRTTVEGKRKRAERHMNGASSAQAPEPHGQRPVHFGKWMDTPIFRRTDLKPGMTVTGPAIVEQSDTTSVVEPGMTLRVDRFHNLIVEVA
jgi:N-methylhydantoinase A/oxoprolinase/acetone carboxylase beta subunit